MTDLSRLLNPDDRTQSTLPSLRSSASPAPGLSDASSPPTPQANSSSMPTTNAPPTPQANCPLTLQAKKQKVAKDAAIFNKAPVQGTINYPPWEDYDDGHRSELESWRIYPLGRVAQYHRHIPYSGSRSRFFEKTGRKAFNLYQYTFKDKETGEEWTVMWDYVIGLVRVTPFFRCLGYSKTVPSKMLDTNNGLRDISISITGGALAAQGYWMPFEAAKAVAATFCFDIRYALTPLFGRNFVNECTPKDDDKFGSMKIDPVIVRRCTAQTVEYRREAFQGTPATLAAMPSVFRTATPETMTSLAVSGTTTPRSVTPAHACTGRWHPVNVEREGHAPDVTFRKPYLPSPSSSLVNEPAWSTPQDRPRLPPLMMLTSAALHDHDCAMDWTAEDDEEPISPKTLLPRRQMWLHTELKPEILHKVRRGGIDKQYHREGPRVDRTDICRAKPACRQGGDRLRSRMVETDLQGQLEVAIGAFDIREAPPEMMEAAETLVKLYKSDLELRGARQASS